MLVFVALSIQHALRMRIIVICGLPRYTLFLHIIPYKTRFSKEKKVSEHKMCFDFFYNFSPKHFSF